MKIKKLFLLIFAFTALSYCQNSFSEYASDYNDYYRVDASDDFSEYYAYPQNMEYEDDNPYYSRYSHRAAQERRAMQTEEYYYRGYGGSYRSRLPNSIVPQGEKIILVDPRVHAWGAYNAKGQLIHAGIATAGAKWCEDLGRPCPTSSGTFRIQTLGGPDCYSRKFPLGEGGAPMPFCMYFNGGQGLHGSNELAEANISHGCVRMSVSDAEWLRYNFARIGTKVIVRRY